jgi:DNA-binding NtrC family response regulator
MTAPVKCLVFGTWVEHPIATVRPSGYYGIMEQRNRSHVMEPSGVPLPDLANSPCRILVVERNPDLRMLYCDALAGPDCQVDVAEDVPTAWAALQAHRYHLILTGNRPPSLTGDELMGKLLSAGMELPVVMVTGRLPLHEPVQNSESQFAVTLRMPFVLQVLLDTTRNARRASVATRKPR